VFKFPTIIQPIAELQSLFTAVLQLKTAVEQLVSSNGRFNAAHVFIQDELPTTSKTGDLWVVPGSANKVYLWTGQAWVPLSADATP
jgi:hypothetical protein